MQSIDVEFQINVNPAIYQTDEYKTVEDFFNQNIVQYIAKDYDFIVSLMQKQKSQEEQMAYENYLITLKDIKSSIEKSIRFELINQTKEAHTFKVVCNFDYYDNEIQTAEKIIQVEIFYTQIKSNRFLAEDLPRICRLSNIPKERADKLIAQHAHVVDLLEEALPTLEIKTAKNNIILNKPKA